MKRFRPFPVPLQAMTVFAGEGFRRLCKKKLAFPEIFLVGLKRIGQLINVARSLRCFPWLRAKPQRACAPNVLPRRCPQNRAFKGFPHIGDDIGHAPGFKRQPPIGHER